MAVSPADEDDHRHVDHHQRHPRDGGPRSPERRLSGRMVDDRGGPLFGRAGIVVGFLESLVDFFRYGLRGWGVGHHPAPRGLAGGASIFSSMTSLTASAKASKRHSEVIGRKGFRLDTGRLKHPDQLITVEMLREHREMVAVQRQQRGVRASPLMPRWPCRVSTSWSKSIIAVLRCGTDGHCSGPRRA